MVGRTDIRTAINLFHYHHHQHHGRVSPTAIVSSAFLLTFAQSSVRFIRSESSLPFNHLLELHKQTSRSPCMSHFHSWLWPLLGLLLLCQLLKYKGGMGPRYIDSTIFTGETYHISSLLTGETYRSSSLLTGVTHEASPTISLLTAPFIVHPLPRCSQELRGRQKAPLYQF